MSPTELLILRGLNILMRTTFAPNDQVRQAEHFARLQQDVGPWFVDYAAAIETALQPAEDIGETER